MQGTNALYHTTMQDSSIKTQVFGEFTVLGSLGLGLLETLGRLSNHCLSDETSL